MKLNFQQEKEDPEMAMELRKMSIDYERRRMQLQIHFGKMLFLPVGNSVQSHIGVRMFLCLCMEFYWLSLYC